MLQCFNALMGQISKWPLGEIESPSGLVVAANGKSCFQCFHNTSPKTLNHAEIVKTSNHAKHSTMLKWLKHLTMLKWLKLLKGAKRRDSAINRTISVTFKIAIGRDWVP